jgi:hypothetical protein
MTIEQSDMPKQYRDLIAGRRSIHETPIDENNGASKSINTSKVQGALECGMLTRKVSIQGKYQPLNYCSSRWTLFVRRNMISVKEKLPDFWNLSKRIASDLRAEKFTDWERLIQTTNPLLEQNFIDKIDKVIPGWRKIATVHDGQTAIHTLLVFVTCLNLPEYGQADIQTRMEIEWAAVLHDLDKDRARNDAAHPFRSAAVAVRIMPELGFDLLPNITMTDLEAWSNLARSAQRQDGERMVHDHSFLQEIIDGIHKCWGNNSPATRVLKAVLLHQSLPTLRDWSSAVLLTDRELSYSLTLEDMDILGNLIIADSDSWNIFTDHRFAYLVEVRASNAETRRRIQKMVNKNEASNA